MEMNLLEKAQNFIVIDFLDIVLILFFILENEKKKAMDNVQEISNCINTLSSETFKCIEFHNLLSDS
jgi:hypothetical protein